MPTDPKRDALDRLRESARRLAAARERKAFWEREVAVLEAALAAIRRETSPRAVRRAGPGDIGARGKRG